MQLAGFILGSLAACGTLITCVMPEWRRQDMAGEVIEMQIRKQGIWWNCMFFSTGQWHCDDFDRIIVGLPPELQAARALMVLSCILAFGGYCIGNMSLSCTTFMSDNLNSKKRLCITSALLLGLSALMTGVSVSFYAAIVVQDFYLSGGMAATGLNARGGMGGGMGATGGRYVYGKALFFGWASMGLGLLGCVLQIMGSKGMDEDEDDYDDGARNFMAQNNTYNNPAFTTKGRTGTEYI